MTGNSLAELADKDIDLVPGLRGKRGADLRKAGVATVADLLLHIPRRYLDRSKTVPLEALPLGEEVTVFGRVERIKERRPRRNLLIVEATIDDGTGILHVVWFNQSFRMRQLAEGTEVALSGKVERYRGRLQMQGPDADVLDRSGESLITGRVMPVHPTVGGVGPGHLRRAIHDALRKARPMPDPLPDEARVRLGLVERDRAIGDIHFPSEVSDAIAARRRLAFDELFRLEVALAARRQRIVDTAEGIAHSTDTGLVEEYLSSLPFEPTAAQLRVIDEIRSDMAAPHPMHRLLQGEVGSGKTVVAMAALLIAVQGGHQGAVMAPTEVLAEQHHLGLAPLGALVGVRMALLTGSSPDREQVLAAVSAGTVDVVVGTHALIQEGVRFARLGLAVVDEQHRFGVHQRVELRERSEGPQPDMLIMTATPIPRTLAMTLYGDLVMSRLDEMPRGRMPVETVVLAQDEQGEEQVFARIGAEVAAGRQAFVVCPLVEDSEKLAAVSATAEHRRLAEAWPDLRFGLLHGQMRSAEKEAVMAEVRRREIDVLVATTVIEVGIDVPNATVMVVEDADRFGLSQLHQLRGRVGRGEHRSWCFLMASEPSEEGSARLAAMASTNDGFRLAEEDLRIRGQGTAFGSRQAGGTDLRIADILADQELLEIARREGFALVAADPGLRRHPAIAEEVNAFIGRSDEWLFIS
ncbi:MAG: ATP-dependent DNA helicase RecG [Acidimicrobiia bacterium]|nr:MAG: ATP-dependent DNA helicase RecG [Acidimicrobiia bacterium]